jgi:hypothetical protein
MLVAADEYDTVAGVVDGPWKSSPVVSWLSGNQGNDKWLVKLTFTVPASTTVVIRVGWSGSAPLEVPVCLQYPLILGSRGLICCHCRAASRGSGPDRECRQQHMQGGCPYRPAVVPSRLPTTRPPPSSPPSGILTEGEVPGSSCYMPLLLLRDT